MSFVMPIILSIIAMLIYLGFYINDRAVLEEAAKEAAIYAAANYPSDIDEAESQAYKLCNEISKKRIIGIRTIDVDVQKKGEYLIVSASGCLKIPFFSELSKKLFGGDFKIAAKGSGVITHPVNKIWMFEIIEDVVGGEDE